MEYLKVNYWEKRKLIVDGRLQGMTNKTIELVNGHHLVSLNSPPNDFTPTEITVLLEDTTYDHPKEINFGKI